MGEVAIFIAVAVRSKKVLCMVHCINRVSKLKKNYTGFLRVTHDKKIPPNDHPELATGVFDKPTATRN